jgi:hypothetical protein
MGHTDACRAGRGSTAFESVVLTSLALLGVAAAPVFEALADCKTRAEDERAVAAVLARLGTREAFDILAKRVDRGAYAASLGEALTRLPGVGAAVLAPLAVERGARAALLMGLLEGQARRDAPALRDALDQLLPALRTRLGGIAVASTPEEATDEELPAVLRAPFWSTRDPRAIPTIPGLATRTIAPQITWQEGEREAWRDASGEVLTTADFVTWLFRAPRPALVAFLDGDDGERDRARDPFASYRPHVGFLSRASISVALRALELLPLHEWQLSVPGMKSIAAAHALDALPLLRAWSRADPASALAVLTNIGDLELARVAIRSLSKKTQRTSAEAWLLAQPQYAAAAAIPVALGSAKARDAATDALRFLSDRGHRTWVEEEAAALGENVATAISDVLASAAASALPSSGVRAMPAFWSPSSFSRPLLKNGRALPLPAIEHLGALLALGREVSQPHPGLASVMEACTPRSLAAFAWDLFHAWSLIGDSAHTWAFFQLGWLGDDDCARALAPLVRQWPGERASARAVLGLDVLEAIGSDVALMQLNGIAERVKVPALQERAREKIERIAEARGLTSAALSDRLVPDLGLDQDGSRTLSFGARSFRVGFDESLRPFVRAADGVVRSDLPKPRATEDAAAAIETWQALKSDAKTIAAQQIARLERAMNERKRWSLAELQALFVTHPLIGHLTRRLIWGVYSVTPDDPAGRLIQAFRVAEDRSFADSGDDTLTLDPQSRVGLAHPVELSSSDAAAFGQRLAEYEILQPFAQLARPTYSLTSQEAEKTELRRFDGLTLPVERVLGLESRGWRRGAPQKNGVVQWMERALPGLPCLAILPIAPGIAMGHVTTFPTQTLRSVSVMDGAVARVLGEVPEVAMSELLRELEPLRL